jgi:hypothetical protein
MPRLHERIETKLATDVAFPFVADFANSSRWDPGVAASERIGEGPTAVGSRYRLMVRIGGRTAPMEYVIEALEAGRRVVLRGSGSGVRAIDDIRFEPFEGGTRVDYTADIHLSGPMRLLEPFLGGAFRKIGQNAMAGMKRTLDAMAAGQTGPAAPESGTGSAKSVVGR